MRELRQNLSVYLRRVERGETLCVTSRGRPVAVLGPLRSERPLSTALFASGERLGRPGASVIFRLRSNWARARLLRSDTLVRQRAERLREE